ncbi:MAG: CofH family radical SAM protein [bacterium]
MKQILSKAANGQPLTREEALALASDPSVSHLHALGQAALQNRRQRFGRTATYVLNAAINPSNICDRNCGFCHYHAAEGDPRAYVLTEDDILRRIAELRPREVHITGGLNRFWPFANARQLISQICARHPAVYIKAYTAVEIDRFAQDEKKTPRDILLSLQEAGLQSLTGGGAELFSERMRRAYCPSKITAEAWLAIHRTAHELGLSSNATLLYGLGESAAELVDHLLRLREAQAQSRGYSCFIPLAYQPEKGNPDDAGPSPRESLRVIALSRLILDNVPHLKAYWPMIGVETAAAALSWGADDLDGTLGEERIAHAGAARTPGALSAAMMQTTIRLGGFLAVERDGNFNAVEELPDSRGRGRAPTDPDMSLAVGAPPRGAKRSVRVSEEPAP